MKKWYWSKWKRTTSGVDKQGLGIMEDLISADFASKGPTFSMVEITLMYH
jgi:hypothetical protein